MRIIGLLLILVSWIGCGDPSPPSTQAERVRLPLTGSGVSEESLLYSFGQFGPVVRAGGCSATIVGPYTVVTARHCSPTTITLDGVTHSVTEQSGHPSAFANNILVNGEEVSQNPYAPDWWRTLDLAQKSQPGGRMDDWAAQHDFRVLHVPTLTPAFLASEAKSGMTITIRPWLAPSTPITERFQVSANNGSSDTRRSYVEIEYMESQENEIVTGARDGYGYLDETTTFSDIERGDSGGPTVGYHSYDYGSGTIRRTRGVLLGVAQGTSAVGAGHTAIASYDLGVDLTPNQVLTARLNYLWLQALTRDSDADLLVDECDADPTESDALNGHGPQNTCPTPYGTNERDVPRAGLICPEGYVATGVRGRGDTVILELAVQCTPVAALLSGDTATPNSFWTEHFGEGNSTSETSFEHTCPDGEAFSGVFARYETTPQLLSSLQFGCADATTLNSGSSSGTSYLPPTSYDDSPSFESSNDLCQGFVRGLDVQSTDSPIAAGGGSRAAMSWITGAQLICARNASESSFGGGTDGTYKPTSCPAGMIAVGMVAGKSNYDSDYIGLSGLLCASLQDVASGTSVSGFNTVVAHSGWRNDSSGHRHLAGVTHTFPFLFEGHSTTVETVFCDEGEYLSNVYLRYSTATPSRVVGFSALECREYADPLNSSLYTGPIPNYESAESASTTSLNCSGQGIDRASFNSGWLLDGMAVGCIALPTL